jgi:hypothetical protein
MTEDKKAFIQGLGELLSEYSEEDIAWLDADDNAETVTVCYGNGYKRDISIKGYSILGIMLTLGGALS